MSVSKIGSDDLFGAIQAMIREEISRIPISAVGEVTELFCHESDSDKNNYQVSVTLRDSGLVLPSVALATQQIGQVAIPRVGELVLVQFVGGDLHRPVVTARLYNDVDRPPVAGPGEWVYESCDEKEDGVRRYEISLPNDNKVTVTDEKATITLGDSMIEIENSGAVTITGAGDVSITAGGGLNLKAGGDIAMEADGSVSIKAAQDVTTESVNASIKADANADVEGGAATKVKGTQITIAGMTNFSAG